MNPVYSAPSPYSLSTQTLFFVAIMMAIFLKIGTLNTGGLSSSAEKRMAIFDLIRENKIDICLLQETNFEPYEEKQIE